MVNAIFFDVDGTLLSHRTKCIPEKTMETLTELRKRGIKLFISTGRHYLELLKLPMGNFTFDGYITLNGQICLDSNGNMIYGTPFDKDITTELVHLFKQEYFPLAFVEEKRIYLNYINDTVREAQQSISTPVPEAACYENGMVYQTTAFFKREEESNFKSFLPQGCKFARWSDNGVDIIARESGKVKGIQFFCEQYNMKQNEIMAFGDAENDIDMLLYAHIGIAMGNANAQVKKIADYVTTDIDDGGIKNAIKHFGNLLNNCIY